MSHQELHGWSLFCLECKTLGITTRTSMTRSKPPGKLDPKKVLVLNAAILLSGYNINQLPLAIFLGVSMTVIAHFALKYPDTTLRPNQFCTFHEWVRDGSQRSFKEFVKRLDTRVKPSMPGTEDLERLMLIDGVQR